MTQSRLRPVPLTVAAANRVVERVHRHHGPCPPALAYFCLGVVDDAGRLVGAAIVGRPANRNSDHSQIAEVLRTATDGTPNACSALLGACARVGRQMGMSRLITYTLQIEPGTSLRAAGWEMEEEGIESWWHRYPEKNAADRRTVVRRPHQGIPKRRWVADLREPIATDFSLAAAELPSGQEAML